MRRVKCVMVPNLLMLTLHAPTAFQLKNYYFKKELLHYSQPNLQLTTMN